ncbi:DUF6928 family protein [Streptomyces sp. NPDC004976]
MPDRPPPIPEHLVAAGVGRRLVLHNMHSVVDWFAFAVWENGRLIRSFSLSPDDGIMENIGEPFPFELPYWAGDRSADVIGLCLASNVHEPMGHGRLFPPVGRKWRKARVRPGGWAPRHRAVRGPWRLPPARRRRVRRESVGRCG